MEMQTFPDSKQALVDRVERLVRQRTSGLIRGLRVEMLAEEVVLYGRTSTYYAKQLATHAALDALDNNGLVNDIEVF